MTTPKKVSELAALAVPAAEDLLLIIDDPSVDPVSKKITLANLTRDINSNNITTNNELILTSLSVGNGVSNSTLSSSALRIGGSSVNTVVTSTAIRVGNSTVNTVITAGNIALNGSQLTIGNTTVNTTLTGEALVIGNTTSNVTITSNGSIVVSSNQQIVNFATESYVDAAVANISGGSANTGDITFDGVKIIGAGDASGDGNGYATLELVPDNSLYENDQYLVVDPTQPNHIHIRAGGTQDNSSTELFLGGERNHVRIIDGEGVKVSNDDFNSEDYYFNLSTDYIQAIWSEDENNYFVDIRITDPFNPVLPINPDWSKFFNLAQFPENRVIVYDGNEYYELSILSAFTLGNPYDLRIQVNQAPPTSPDPSTLEIIQFKIYTLTQNYLSLEESNLYVEVKEDVSVYASAAIRFTTGTGSFQITTDDDNNSNAWYFNRKGHLEFPRNVAPTSSKGSQDDEEGAVAFDGEYIYYCTQSYSDGETDIWKRVAWSNDTWGE